ncbi:MAG: hypothetical protein CFE25_05510 [Chitinophagaceae bacterium BSSC1]|nr:MAG: hypothetical protein CFE25_05510 [Chitinophagaceae bacterium BSSC1]
MTNALKLLVVNFDYDQDMPHAQAQLEKHASTDQWIKALDEQGLEIECCKRFHSNLELAHQGIPYFFRNDGFEAKLPFWYPAIPFIRFILSRKPDIVHVHGTHFPLQTLFLKLLAPKQTKIVVQHHGGLEEQGIKSWIKKKMLGFADAFFFTSLQQGESWFKYSFRKKQIFSVMEGSTQFQPMAKQKAIAALGLTGSPKLVWIGRLYDNKDPLTVLEGFELFCNNYPQARLYMIYHTTDLLAAVKTKISESPFLERAVCLVGSCSSQEVEQYLNAADYFVLGSHYEGSGYALCEAIACGCVPVVTNIPSFQMMTNGGSFGGLWEPGNPQAFYRTLLQVVAKNQQIESEKALAFFASSLSFSAIASISKAHYQRLLNSNTLVAV